MRTCSAPLCAEPQILMVEDKIGENPHLDEIPSMGPFAINSINQTRTSLRRHSFFPFKIPFQSRLYDYIYQTPLYGSHSLLSFLPPLSPPFPLLGFLHIRGDIAPRILQQAPRGRIRAMRHVIMGPQCGGCGEFDSLWVPFSGCWMARSSPLCIEIRVLSHSCMSAIIFFGTVRYILTIFYAYMRHILSQSCSAASHLSRCVVFFSPG